MSESRTSNGPSFSAENWYSAAVAIAIMVCVGVFVSAIAVIIQPSALDRYHLVQVLAPFGVAGIAFVTFCTVAWRGIISSEQLKAQRDQIEKISEQIASTDENNLALLIQKGAELLAESGNRAHIAAGIATLQAVITAKNPKFAREAMELVADLVDERFQHSNHEPLFRAASEAIRRGAELGHVAVRQIDFTWKDDVTKGSWKVFPGVELLKYTGGTIQEYAQAEDITSEIKIECENVRFVDCSELVVSDRHVACTFINCHIRQIDLGRDSVATFERCDFTGCIVTGADTGQIEFKNCYYSKEEKPNFPIQWLEKIAVLEMSSTYDDSFH